MEYGTLINISNDEVVEVTRRKRTQEPYPGYMIVGDGSETKRGGKSMDLLDVCKELNMAEMNLLQFFRDRIKANIYNKEKNTHIVIPTRCEEWTDYLQIALKKNYPHMNCLGIVQRVKRGTYMLNPSLFIPSKDMEWYKKEWDNIREECSK